MSQIVLVSAMICSVPRYVRGRLMLSAYDGVWDAIEELPDDLKPYLTDDIGNTEVSYGGFLQVIDPGVLDAVRLHDFYLCFRGVSKDYIEHIMASPPFDMYMNIIGHLKFMGWDISTGNGWVSASCEGYYPIDPFTGEDLDGNSAELNNFGLFVSEDKCLEYCEINNNKRPARAPWYPVAVYVDNDSYHRLSSYFALQDKGL